VRRKPFGFTLKKNETEVFEIWAVTAKCYCRWVIELDLVVNGTHAAKTITNKGQPFQTTAWSCCRSYVWVGGAWYIEASGEPQPRNKPLKPLPELAAPGAAAGVIGRSSRSRCESCDQSIDTLSEAAMPPCE
jgi:hypothetical protein